MKKSVAIVGAGKIAYSVTSSLLKAGYNVNCIVSRNINSAKKLAEKFSVRNHSDSFKNLPAGIKIFFLTVPDSEIRNAAKNLSASNYNLKNCNVIHLSGVETISALSSVKKKGALTGSLHLMQTFPDKRIVNLEDVHASIETDNNTVLKFLNKLGNDLDLKTFQIKSDKKVFYHLAGVFASNFLAGNLFYAEELIKSSNLKEKSYDILQSTISSTLKNIKRYGAANALSGPVDRGDVETVKLHLSSIKKLKRRKGEREFGSLLLNNYINQSLALLILVERKTGTLTERHIKIKELLINELKKI